MIIDLDLLGLGSKHWPVALTVRVLKSYSRDSFNIGFFDEAPQLFGNPLPALRAMAEGGNISSFRVQLWYEKTHANGKLIDISRIEERAPLYQQLARRFPHIPVYISHTTEHCNPSRTEVAKRIEAIRRYAPDCIPVNNPLKAPVHPGVINETHMKKVLKAQYLASMDGMDCFDADTFSWCKLHNNAYKNYIWCERFNMNDVPDEDDEPADYIPPADRTAAPTEAHLRGAIAMGYLWEPRPSKGVLKRVYPGRIEFKRPRLYKVLSQDTNDGREGKPLVILPVKAREAEIVALNGKTIGVFSYYGKYYDEHRYYSGHTGGIGLSGEEIALKAKKEAGSCWIAFKVGRQFFGPVHPVYRRGYYR